tara:strand:- start:1709 stop:2488 length:780 start_codon:yes stop_codon:yes gene_type:complete
MNKYNQLFDLKNKVAVVIGGAGYLCSSMVKALYHNGCKVVIIDLRKKKIEKLLKEIPEYEKERLIYFTLDALNKKKLIETRNKIIKKFKMVNILINGAGINAPTDFFNISYMEWKNIIDSHITTTLYGCQVFGLDMIKKKEGSIINISSASAGPPLSKAFAYSAAKSAVKNITQNLAREWGTKGVRVNCIRPGFFPTEWNKKNFLDKKRIKNIFNHTPMRRFGDPYELVGAIIWLSSNSSSFVTGAEINVDGGFSCMTI